MLAWDIREPSERGRFPVWHDDILPVLEDTLARFWSNSAAHNAVKSHLEHEQTVFHPWYSGLAQERDGLDPAKPGDTARRNETKKLVRLYLACIRKRLETVVAIINSRGIDAAKDFVVSSSARRFNVTWHVADMIFTALLYSKGHLLPPGPSRADGLSE